MIGQDSEDEAEAKPIVRRYNSMSELMIERNPEPYNAEPVPGALIERFLTPQNLFYVRSHGPVPDLPGPVTAKLCKMAIWDFSVRVPRTGVRPYACSGRCVWGHGGRDSPGSGEGRRRGSQARTRKSGAACAG